MNKPKAIALFGPTASGKTATAIALAQALNGEIINMDSVQIYREMNIGSAKPSSEELSAAVHHLIDIRNPDEPMNSFELFELAIETGKAVSERGKLPIFAGGTGLYFKAIFEGLFEGPGRDETIRAKLQAEKEELGQEVLYERLKLVDPETAERVSVNDYVRIERALEVYELSGKPISQFHREQIYEPPFDYSCIAMDWARKELYARIEQRVELMLEEGLEEEVTGLLEKYPDAHILKTAIGYKEVVDFLQGKTDRQEMIRLLKRNTRRFAKRQLTLFRGLGNVNVQWVHPSEENAEKLKIELEK